MCIFRGIQSKNWSTSRIYAVATIVCNSCGRNYRKCKSVVNDLVIMSDDMEDLKEKFWNWKDALKSKGLKINTRKTKVMVSGSEGELFKSKIDLRGVCGRRVMANSVLCKKCGNWVLFTSTKSIHCLHFIAQLLNRIHRPFHYSFTFQANKIHCQPSGSSLYFCTFAMNPVSTFYAQH